MNLGNLLSSDEKKRIADERKKRDNRYIDEKYYKGPYASRQMITGPQSKALLSMRTHGGNEAAKKELEQILEAEAILWPEKTRRLAHQKPKTKTERKPTESRT